MSDRPSSTNSSEQEKNAWHQPETPGGWRAPKSDGQEAGWRAPAVKEEAPGWRVPALPKDLNVEPENSGVWHLPKPEDTTYSPEDELHVAASVDGEQAVEETEEAASVEAQAEAAPVEAEPEAAEPVAEEMVLPFDEVTAPQPAVAEEPAPEPEPAALPFDDDLVTPQQPTSEEPAEAEAEGETVTPALAFEDEEDDEDKFSMSELIALASLVEGDQPVRTDDVTPEQPANPDDPAEYARRQLERLAAAAQSEQAAAQPGAAAPAAPATPAAAAQPAASAPTDDPAEYARRQLEMLSGGAAPAAQAPAAAPAPVQPAPEPAAPVSQPVAEQPAAPAQPAVPTLSAPESQLLEKYRSTENRVRDLRAQYRAGTMTRDQLQTELRQYMVLDEAQTWWMMGVETDQWYKYQDGQWVNATPAVITKAAEVERAAAAAAAPAPAPQTPSAPAQTSQPVVPPASFEDGATVPTAAVRTDDDYMPLPRAVPVRDPDFTLPGTAGVYIPPAPSNLDVTQPMGSQPTVPTRAVNDYAIPTPAPIDTYAPTIQTPIVEEDAPPSYDLQPKAAPVYEEVAKKKRQSTMRTLLIAAVVGLGLLVLVAACGIIYGVITYSNLAEPYRDDVAALANYQPEFQTARIYDADGNIIVELNSQTGGARTSIPLAEMSPFLVHALIATENERFYEDPGWDPIAIARAIIQNFTDGGVSSGASTITQQVARNLILRDYSISAERKLQEIVVAAEIAQQYDKNFILEIYLNEFFFGNQSYGVEAAAQFYFNKSAADLNAAESAMLIGLIQSPATYDPVINKEAALGRMNVVLARMRQQGCIQFHYPPYEGEPFCIDDSLIRLNNQGSIQGGDILVQRAQIQIRDFRPRQYRVQHPHFVNFVQAQIEQSFGTDEMFRRGFNIYTTLRPSVQETAQNSLARYVQAAAGTGINTGAVMVTNPQTGEIWAMVGSPDFNNVNIDGQVNNVLTWQQPGSSIKPIVYTAALEGVDRNGQFQYMTPSTIIWDVPTTYNTTPPYTPTNYDRRYRGPVSLRYSLQNSLNVTAIKALEFVGLDKFREVATRMGLRFLEESIFGLPSALGANEVRLYDHMQAFGTFANGGQRVPLFAITRITDIEGNEVELPPRAQPVQAIQPEIAFLMANVLSDNEARIPAFGANSGLAIPGYDGMIGAKTGTTNDAADLWTMGFSSTAVVGVWTGTVNNQPTSATTSTAAIPIFNETMRAALSGTSPVAFNSPPPGVQPVQVCGLTGTLIDANAQNQTCPDPRNDFAISSQLPPPATQSFVVTLPIDTWTGLVANNFCAGNSEYRRFINISDPSAIQWIQTTAEGQAFAQQLNLPADVQAAPTQQCDANTPQTNIQLQQPTNGQQVSGQYPVLGTVNAPNLNRYQLEVAPGNNPTSFVIVHGPITTPVQAGGTLGTWDTTRFSNGIYILRLAAFSNDGGYVYRTAEVGVNNIAPTPTPFPTADPFGGVPTQNPFGGTIPTQDPFAPTSDGFTNPLPFDIIVATATPQGAIQPTAEVPGLGGG